MVALGNCTVSSWIKSATKIPKRVGLSLLPSGTPRRMSTLLLLGIHGWRTQTLTVRVLERCHGGARWAHGYGAQGTQVWVIDTRRGGGTPG